MAERFLYWEQVEEIKQLKREGRFREAFDLLSRCREAVTMEALYPHEEDGYMRAPATPAPAYWWESAVILRRLGDRRAERAILEDFEALKIRHLRATNGEVVFIGSMFPKIQERLDKMREQDG